MSAPPWVFSCIFSVAIAYSSDRYQEKVRSTSKITHELLREHCADIVTQFWHIVGPVLMGMVGFIISMATEIVAARYVALFLQAGSYAG